jgi:para-nitrobenzyl esterase
MIFPRVTFGFSPEGESMIQRPLLGLLLLAACAPSRGDDLDSHHRADSVAPVVDLGGGMALQGVDGVAGPEFHGIPYAAPPVGDLRWRPPAPPPTWSGIRAAVDFAPMCPQFNFTEERGEFIDGDEDCLYLNVFAPPGASGAPVMVHLHGGGNAFGQAYRETRAFVSRGAVVVTLNYRLGVLGFMGHPALTAEGNYAEQGVLDQLAALRWVKQHIAAFGGDPDNVTLFGHSAGSFDTSFILASPLRGDLVHKAIISTSAYWPNTGINMQVADSEFLGLDVAALVGCAGAPDVAACLRATDVAALVQAGGYLDIGPPVGGTVRPASLLALAPAVDLPVLIGANREDDGYVWYDEFFPGDSLTQGDYVRLVADWFKVQTAATLRKHHYPPDAYPSLFHAWATLLSDAIHVCPARELALALGGPTWRYLFTHVPSQPDYAPMLASHNTTEVYVWGNWDFFFDGGPDHVPTASEQRLADTLADYWTNFAHASDPNVGAPVPPWPRHDLDLAAETYQVLDDEIVTAAGYHVRECTFVNAQPLGQYCNSLCKGLFARPYGQMKKLWGF